MKKSTIAIVLCLLAAVLVVINRKISRKNDEAVRARQLEFEIDGISVFFAYDENDGRFASFATQMKKRNGDVFDKEYSGLELKRIVDSMGYPLSGESAVTVVCADNYEIVLTGEEVLDEGNVYLVTRESGEELDEESGPFMLVVNHDEFSTRWARNVVKIRING